MVITFHKLTVCIAIDISLGTSSIFTACDVNSNSALSCSSVDWNALLKKEGKVGASHQCRVIKLALQPNLCQYLAIANELGEIYVIPLRSCAVS